MKTVLFFRRRQAFAAVFAALALFLAAARPAAAFDLFAQHEVTVHFATTDGKAMADTAVKVFAPGDATTPALTGRTDAKGAFTFAANQDGFWSAEADSGHEVARVMIRVGAAPDTDRAQDIPKWVLYAALGAVLVLALGFRYLRNRARRARRR